MTYIREELIARLRQLARTLERTPRSQEAQVDNFLHHHKIAHSLHPLYPPHADLNARKSLIADWRLEADGALVEHFGLLQKDWYLAKTDRKRRLAAATGVTLIEVTPEDLRTESLRVLFGRYLGGG